MDESPTNDQEPTRPPFWRIAIGVVGVAALTVLADRENGWIAALVVGVVSGGYALPATLHWNRYAAWRQRHLFLNGLILGPWYFVMFACTTGSVGGGLFYAGAMTLFLTVLGPLVQWFRRREERYQDYWRRELHPEIVERGGREAHTGWT